MKTEVSLCQNDSLLAAIDVIEEKLMCTALIIRNCLLKKRMGQI